MTTQYDKIGEDYAQITGSMAKQYTAGPLFMDVLGDVVGKDVLDVACGAGYFTRKIKKRGAENVVGIDISEKMIELARAEEESEPLGIVYLVGNAANFFHYTFNPKGSDIVTGTYLLHYAKSEEELRKICRNMSMNINPFSNDRRFIAINMNPNNNVQQPNPKYGMTTDSNGDLQNGDNIRWTLHADDREASFETYYWDKATYEKALIDAGFEDIVWHPMEVTDEGIERFGKEYWEDYLVNPSLTVLECRTPPPKYLETLEQEMMRLKYGRKPGHPIDI